MHTLRNEILFMAKKQLLFKQLPVYIIKRAYYAFNMAPVLAEENHILFYKFFDVFSALGEHMEKGVATQLNYSYAIAVYSNCNVIITQAH